MNTVLKAAVVLLPFVLIFVGIRACAGGEAERWRARIAQVDPEAAIAVDRDGLIVIAPDRAWGVAAGDDVTRFRSALIENYSDLLGPGRDQRIVVVLFSTLLQLQTLAGRGAPLGPGDTANLHGYTEADKAAIYLPPGSSLDTLRHETVHLLMGQSQRGTVRFSPWLTEGLAQLFEHYDPDSGRAPGIGEKTRFWLRRTRTGESLDIKRLLALVDYGEFTGKESMRNYQDALILTAFLFQERPRAKLRDYIEGERRQPEDRDVLFHRIYAYDTDEFQSDLRKFIAREKRRG